jgi:hypothetical protein
LNTRSLILMVFLIPAMLILSGCRRKKSLLLNLSVGMSKNEVKSKIGQPDEILTPMTDSKGNIIEIWEYSLATVDRNQQAKKIVTELGLFAICPPLTFIPSLCMESEYNYDTYFLKFVNDFLFKWGRRSDNILEYKV